MKIAVEGCAHGELDKIYECVLTLQQQEGINVDLLICCGDFQSVRNKDDLKAMAVPEKYQNICSFYKYYSGEKRAPILTIFIGGNHEASNYLQELPYGGWVAPNIYYLGRSGVVRFGELRIGGLSGIFKGRDYLQGLWESPPYNQNSLRSVYHIRSLDVFRLSQLKEKVHVILSHDWPRGITSYGNREQLLKRKPFFREDIETNQLGSPPSENLLNLLKPDYWFAAHLHCQFAALVQHEEDQETKFLALDKCLPKRRHLQILDLPPEFDGDKQLRYDPEWLAVLRNTNHLLTVRNMDCHLPGPGGNERYDFTPTSEEKEEIVKLLGELVIKEDTFVMTAPPYHPNSPRGVMREPVMNPQTANLCEVLGIDDPLLVVMARSGKTLKKADLNLPIQTESNNPPATPMKTSRLMLPTPVTPSQNTESINIDDSEDATSTAADSIIPVESNTDNSVITDPPATSVKTSCLMLTTPVTPSQNTESINVNDSENSTTTVTAKDSIITVESNADNSVITVNSSTMLSDSSQVSSNNTPGGGKKTFKRRNQAMYSQNDDDVSASNNCSEVSPSPNKSPFRPASDL